MGAFSLIVVINLLNRNNDAVIRDGLSSLYYSKNEAIGYYNVARSATLPEYKEGKCVGRLQIGKCTGGLRIAAGN